MFIGAGASATKPVGKSTHLVVAAVAYLAHKEEGHYTTGPEWLPTGDTTSAYHLYSNRTNMFLLSFGLRGYTKQHHADHGLYWFATSGLGADRFRYVQDVTEFYSNERYHIDETRFFPFAFIGAGIGYMFPLRNADLSCTLSDNWSLALGDRATQTYPTPAHHSAVLSIGYAWGL